MSDAKYMVYKVFRNSGRREIIRKNLTEKEAQKLAQSYPDRKLSMVVYNKQK